MLINVFRLLHICKCIFACLNDKIGERDILTGNNSMDLINQILLVYCEKRSEPFCYRDNYNLPGNSLVKFFDLCFHKERIKIIKK